MDEKIIKSLMAKALQTAKEDMGEFVGVPLTLGDVTFERSEPLAVFSDVFDTSSPVIDLAVSGKFSGSSCMIVDPKVAIYAGCKLLMIPDAEVGQRLKDQAVDEEIQDAFGEIANVAIGAASGVFEGNKKVDIKVKKGELTIVDPLGCDEEDVPGAGVQSYYVRASIAAEGKDLGEVFIFIPEDAFPGAAAQAAAPAPTPQPPAQSEASATQQASQAVTEPEVAAPTPEGGAFEDAKPEPSGSVSAEEVGVFAANESVVILKATDGSVDDYVGIAESLHKQVIVLEPSQDIRSEIAGKDIPLLMLVLDSVTPQGLSHVIKVKTFVSAKTALVVCAPGWTRGAVKEAVTYGVKDILLTPAENDHIKDMVLKYVS